MSRTPTADLADIAEKRLAGKRLSLDDGVRLFEYPDLHAVGALANREREKRHGAVTEVEAVSCVRAEPDVDGLFLHG